MGTDVIITEEDQRNHFTWCWDNTIENFSKEKIFFKDRGNFFEYFWNFFFDAYYYQQIENRPVRITEYFDKLFNFKYRKSRSELDMLTEIYKLFEQNLKR